MLVLKRSRLSAAGLGTESSCPAISAGQIQPPSSHRFTVACSAGTSRVGQGSTDSRWSCASPLPVDRCCIAPMSWRLRADTQEPAELQMDEGLGDVIRLAFLAGNDVVAAACARRKVTADELIAGVMVRSADGLF